MYLHLQAVSQNQSNKNPKGRFHSFIRIIIIYLSCSSFSYYDNPKFYIKSQQSKVIDNVIKVG